MNVTALSAEQGLIEEYLKRISAGLKGIDDAQKHEILAEISSHLSERIAELRAHGEPHPTDQAISSLGDPAQLASQFVTEAQTSHGVHSYAPWTLLLLSFVFASGTTLLSRRLTKNISFFGTWQRRIAGQNC